MFIKRLGAFFLDILEVIVFSIAIFLFIYLLILQPHKIKGASMEPNFFDGEYLLTDKVTYRFNDPKRGDVVVFKAPGQNGEEFIKRIISLPSERISLKEGKVLINGKELNEYYLGENVTTQGGGFIKNGEEYSIPEGHYLVFGDNRSFSSDSRSWGFISREMITGRAWLIYWPFSKIGSLPEATY